MEGAVIPTTTNNCHTVKGEVLTHIVAYLLTLPPWPRGYNPLRFTTCSDLRVRGFRRVWVIVSAVVAIGVTTVDRRVLYRRCSGQGFGRFSLIAVSESPRYVLFTKQKRAVDRLSDLLNRLI